MRLGPYALGVNKFLLSPPESIEFLRLLLLTILQPDAVEIPLDILVGAQVSSGLC
jgi:hypothetical protein